jgi:FixJ family two-component response regulator
MIDDKSLIVIVDDDLSIREAMVDLIDALGLKAVACDSPRQFLASEWLAQAACLIVDIQMPDMNGLELQTKVGQIRQSLPIIFLTSADDLDVRLSALNNGASAYLNKPVDQAELIIQLRKALARPQPHG